MSDPIVIAVSPKTPGQRIQAYLIQRAKDPDTYHGLTLTIAALGISLSPQHTQAILVIGAIISGIVKAGFPD